MARIAAELGVPMIPWQRMVADVASEYDPRSGIPCYREVVVTVPRQSGKTTEEFTFQIDRGLLWGRPQRLAYTAQTGQDARMKVTNDFLPLLRRSPFNASLARVLRGAAETAIEFRNGSRLEVLASAEEAGHGRTLDQATIDEAFADEDDRREQGILPAMATRADAQLFVFSTMGTGRSTYLNRKVAAGRAAVESGATSGIAYFEWSAEDDADPDDPRTWWATMPALGYTITEDTVRHARLTMTDGEFRRAYLNQQREHDDRWLPAGAWSDCRHPSMSLPPDGTPITIGFDGSYNRDATAIAGCTLDGHVFEIGLWERPVSAPDDWVIPRDKVDAAIHRAMARWQVRELLVDRSRWFAETETWWERYGDVVTDVRPENRRWMSDACAAFYGAVREHKLTHDGSDSLARHLANAIVKETPDGAYITKDRRDSPRKIDLAVAAVMAHQAARLVQPVLVPEFFAL